MFRLFSLKALELKEKFVIIIIFFTSGQKCFVNAHTHIYTQTYSWSPPCLYTSLIALLAAALVNCLACHQLVWFYLHTLLLVTPICFYCCCFYFYSSLNDIFLRNSKVCRLFMHFNPASGSPAYAPFQFHWHCSIKSLPDSCCNLDYPVFCLHLCLFVLLYTYISICRYVSVHVRLLMNFCYIIQARVVLL